MRNSRLGGNKFPFGRRRELAGKSLIYLIVFRAEARFLQTIEKILGFTGITGNCSLGRGVDIKSQKM